MVDERGGEDVAQRLMDEIRADIPVYDDFVYDEGLRFARKLSKDEGLAPKGDASAQWGLLYTAVTGFMGGYGTAVDGEWSEDSMQVDGDVAESAGWKQMGSALVRSLGRLPRPMTLPRTASFARSGMQMGLDDTTQFYSSYGFARGLERGFEHLESGEAQLKSDAGKRLVAMAAALDRAVVPAVEDAMADMRDSVRILVTQILPTASPDTFAYESDAADEAAATYDEVTAMPDIDAESVRRAEMDAIRESSPEAWDALAKAMRQATRSGVWEAVSGLSGANACDEESVTVRCFSYAHHFLTGVIDAVFDCVDTPEILDFSAWGQEYEIFDSPGHADDIIDMSCDIGRLDRDEAIVAKIHMRMLCDYARESMGDMPDADDAFWTVAGVAYAHGIRHASEMGYEADEQAHADFEEMMEREAEHQWELSNAATPLEEGIVFAPPSGPFDLGETEDDDAETETLEMELASGDFFGDFVLSVVPNPAAVPLRSQFVLLAQAYGATPEADVAAIGVLSAAALVGEPSDEAKWEFFKYVHGLCQVKEGLEDALRRRWYEIGAWRVLGNWFMVGGHL